MRQLLIYPDTSVFGGCFDDEFKDASGILFEQVISGRYLALVSPTTIRELDGAPLHVRSFAESLPPDRVVSVEEGADIKMLREAYLRAGVVGENSRLDAEHIASATVGRADLIVSWNFKHIVNFERIRGYHAVNIMHGYQPIPIHSPPEIIV